MLYDLTRTASESAPLDDGEDKRRYGYSNDRRGRVEVTAEGFPPADEVMRGNAAATRRCAGPRR